ncbi:MAG: DUF2383 domain-containing protein [Pseudomonadota bacterium]
MEVSTSALNSIVSVLKSGAQFYAEAAKQTNDPGTAEVFEELAQTRFAAIEEIDEAIRGFNETPAAADWVDQARAMYASIKAMTGDTEATLVDSLYRHEQHTLASLKHALDDVVDRDIRSMLLRHYETFFSTHAKMEKLSQLASHTRAPDKLTSY